MLNLISYASCSRCPTKKYSSITPYYVLSGSEVVTKYYTLCYCYSVFFYVLTLTSARKTSFSLVVYVIVL